MAVQILPSAIADLANGRDFYNKQGEGLGQYPPLGLKLAGPAGSRVTWGTWRV